MNTRIRQIGLFVVTALAVILAGCARATARAPEVGYTYVANAAEEPASSSSDAPAALPQVPANGLTQTNDERSVVVAVTPLNLGGSDPTLDFQVALNTHSVELGYNLTDIAVLRDDQGNEYTPIAWDGGQGGHHVDGVLRFDGHWEIVRPGLKYLELELKGIAQVSSRLFRWEFQ